MLSFLFRTGFCVLAFSMSVCGQDPFQTDPFGADPFGNNNADPFAQPAPQRAQPRIEQRQPERRRPEQNKPLSLQQREQRIRAVLEATTDMNVIELPIQDFATWLSQEYDLPVVVDRRALEELGIGIDAPVSISLKDVSLRVCLRLALREHDLTYMVMHGVVQLTSTEVAAHALALQTYRLPDSLVAHSDQLLGALTATVGPDQWQEAGGPSAAAIVDRVLVVSATEAGHAGVQDFLEKVQASMDAGDSSK